MIYCADIDIRSAGYTSAALLYLCALHKAGRRDVTILPMSRVIEWRNMPPWASGLREIGAAEGISRAVAIIHHTPETLGAFGSPAEKATVGLTVVETDSVPAWVVRAMDKRLLALIVPSLHNAEAFRGSGYTGAIHVLGHPVEESWGEPHKDEPKWRIQKARHDKYVFYFIGVWNRRKNPEAVLRAFCRAFPVIECGVELWLKLTAPASFQPLVRQIIAEECGTDARLDQDIFLYTETMNEDQLRWFHTMGDCFVSAHRGEGWGLSLFQAACLGKPVIYTGWSAPLEFLCANGNATPHRPLPYRLEPTGELAGNIPFFCGRHALQWAAPDEEALVAELRTAAVTRLGGSSAHARKIRETWAQERIGKALGALVDDIAAS